MPQELTREGSDIDVVVVYPKTLLGKNYWERIGDTF